MAKRELIMGDCIDRMRSIEAESIDAIITDPPYGIDFQSARVHKEKRRAKIPNDKRPYIWWINEAMRVLKDGGCILCFARWDIQQRFIDAFELAGAKVKNVIVWDKMAHGTGDLKGQFAPNYETIIFATKGRFEFPGKRPNDILHHKKVPASKLMHPNEKPVPLLKELIEATTSEGETVLDPFMGSGTTIMAAQEAGRNAIGIELSEGTYILAEERLKEHARD